MALRFSEAVPGSGSGRRTTPIQYLLCARYSAGSEGVFLYITNTYVTLTPIEKVNPESILVGSLSLANPQRQK